jgi:hypothetical protein
VGVWVSVLVWRCFVGVAFTGVRAAGLGLWISNTVIHCGGREREEERGNEKKRRKRSKEKHGREKRRGKRERRGGSEKKRKGRRMAEKGEELRRGWQREDWKQKSNERRSEELNG